MLALNGWTTLTDRRSSSIVLRSVAPLLFAALLLLVGAFFLLWGDVLNACSQASFNGKLSLISQIEEYGRCGGDADESVKELYSVYESYEDWFAAYDCSVAAGEMPVNDPFEGYPAGEGLSYLESTDYLIGSISIPGIDCDLPLYFGADDDHLSKGAAVISGTSIPLGDVNSNCVIAGHRGWMSARYFRDIENVGLGDALTLTLPWGVFSYRAVGSAVIDPNDVEALTVFPGKDMVTIITCHPYGYNYQRYIVYFQRVDDAAASETSVDKGFSFAGSSVASPLIKVENVLRLLGIVLAATSAVLLAFGLRKIIRGFAH